MEIYEPLEIEGPDGTPTGRWRMAYFSDERPRGDITGLCDCPDGRASAKEAQDCPEARSRMPQTLQRSLQRPRTPNPL